MILSLQKVLFPKVGFMKLAGEHPLLSRLKLFTKSVIIFVAHSFM